ncbi:MAG: hypothetical protein M3431_04430, partial [Actinomycetota bacterium]|nr:hypothetical protein [Actinomycetota bacterium]
MPLLDAVGDGEVIQAYVLFEPLVLDPGRTNLTPDRLEEMMAEMTVVDLYRSIMVVEILDEDDDTRTEILLDYGDEDDAVSNIDTVE